MTLFLASVRDADEAVTALAYGADIIDAKDPRTGALGALAMPDVSRIVREVNGRRPVSAVLGNLPMHPAALAQAAASMGECGITYLKIGLFPSDEAVRCIAALGDVAPGVKKIGVMFADLEPDQTLLGPLAEAGFHGVMIDTAGKSSGRLFDHLDASALAAFVDDGHARGLQVGLAGSLETPDVPRLLPLRPDFLGFRRAICGPDGRAGRVRGDAVKTVRDLIPVNDAAQALATAANVDLRLLAARFMPSQKAASAADTDRIFVRDFVVPMRVGAYGHEHDKTQRVRFNVDAEITRLDRPAADMRDVVSYDVITDGIRLTAAREHVPLVEILAEKVADLVLEMPRVLRVRVRVEKLDIHPGSSVGVEIVREPRRAEPGSRQGGAAFGA